VQFLNEATVMRKLRRLYPFDNHGYFFDGECASLKSVTLSDRVGLDRMIRVTLRYARHAGLSELIGFNDRLVGWKGTRKPEKLAAVRLAPSELPDFIERHVYFRDPKRYSDNYYFTAEPLNWFAVFCHEGDWHLFSRQRAALSSLSLR